MLSVPNTVDHFAPDVKHQLVHSHHSILLILSGRLAFGREGAAREDTKLKQGEEKRSFHLYGLAYYKPQKEKISPFFAMI